MAHHIKGSVLPDSLRKGLVQTDSEAVRDEELRLRQSVRRVNSRTPDGSRHRWCASLNESGRCGAGGGAPVAKLLCPHRKRVAGRLGVVLVIAVAGVALDGPLRYVHSDVQAWEDRTEPFT